MPPVFAFVGAFVTSAVAATASFLGVSTAIAGAVLTTAVSVGASLLKGGPKAPATSRENANRLRANIDVRTPRKTVVGRTALATDIRDEELTGSNQDYFHRFIVCASHKLNAIEEIWFDDKQAWTSAGGVQGEFVGYLTVATVLEGSAANAINISARMGSSRRFTGCGYVHLRYKLTGNDSKVDSPFAQTITTRITIIGKGASIYDPRHDSTVPGGSGSQRADNQATWTWDDNACENPALALLFYLLGWKINGELAVGKGIPKDRLDLESFAVAANICDETVTAASGTEPRYRCAGVWSEGDSPTTVIDMLKACMNADLDDVDGKLRLTIFTDDTFSSDADFTADDLIGKFEWEAIRPLDQSFNIVRGTYTDPSAASLYQQVDYPQVAETSLDGIDRIQTLDLPMVESAGQCQRLAKLRLTRESFGGVFKADFQATAWRVQKNSIVRLTFAPLGFVNKTFRVAEMDLRVDGVVPLVLREEDPSIYVAPAIDYGIAGVNSTPYDPSKNPIIDALTSPVITLSATTQIITYDGFGALDPTSQTNTFSIERSGTTATCNWTLEDLLGNTLTPATYLSATTGDSVTMTAANFSAAIAVNGSYGVKVKATVVDGITVTETISVYKLQAGSDALIGFLTNPDVTLAATNAGVVSSFATASGNFKVYLGTDDVTSLCAFAEVLETNCTGTINATTGAYSISALAADIGSYKMSATFGSAPAIEQIFTLSKARAGATGATGLTGATGATGATGSTGPAGRAAMVYNQSVAPSSGMIEGDLWYNTATLRWYRYTSGAWALLQGAVSALDIVTNAYIGTAAIGSANIGNLEVNSAHIANLTVGTGKIANNSITVPYLAGGSYKTGNGTYQTLYTGSIVLSDAGVIYAAFTAKQAYVGGTHNWALNILVDGSAISGGSGGAGYTDALSCSGSVSVAAGTHSVSVQWYGDSSQISLYNDSFIAQGFMK